MKGACGVQVPSVLPSTDVPQIHEKSGNVIPGAVECSEFAVASGLMRPLGTLPDVGLFGRLCEVGDWEREKAVGTNPMGPESIEVAVDRFKPDFCLC